MFISTIGNVVSTPPDAKELLNHDRPAYRIVFEEIGAPLHSLENFHGLKGSAKGMPLAGSQCLIHHVIVLSC